MKELTDILRYATSGVTTEYFHLLIHGSNPVYRERVYCYELYHQMRLLWPAGSPYRLNGELDKAAHPILHELGASFAKPDFLVHTPGDMAGNHAVIEVKSEAASNRAIEADLEKLALFKTRVGYHRAIYLIYGHHADAAVSRAKTRIAASQEYSRLIELWCHFSPGKPASRI